MIFQTEHDESTVDWGGESEGEDAPRPVVVLDLTSTMIHPEDDEDIEDLSDAPSSSDMISKQTVMLLPNWVALKLNKSWSNAAGAQPQEHLQPGGQGSEGTKSSTVLTRIGWVRQNVWRCTSVQVRGEGRGALDEKKVDSVSDVLKYYELAPPPP